MQQAFKLGRVVGMRICDDRGYSGYSLQKRVNLLDPDLKNFQLSRYGIDFINDFYLLGSSEWVRDMHTYSESRGTHRTRMIGSEGSCFKLVNTTINVPTPNNFTSAVD